MRLVFIHGPPAVGKLTVARRLETLTGFPLLHNHLIVDMVLAVFDFGSPPFVEMRETIWLNVMERAAQERLPGLITTFTPEHTVSPNFVDAVVTTIESTGGEVLFVPLVCPEAELERRMENQSRAEFAKLRSLSLYRELRNEGAFAYTSLPDSGLVIDTSKTQPDKAARLIIDYFGLSVRD